MWGALLWGVASGSATAEVCPARTVPVEGLDGVQVVFPAQPCRFERGRTPPPLRYRIEIDRDLGELVHSPVHCFTPDDGGFIVHARVVQGEHSYDPWDDGDCLPPEDPRTSPVAGVFTHSFPWSPHRFQGPSCTNEKPGEAFAAGPAELIVRFAGARRGEEFSVDARWPITIE